MRLNEINVPAIIQRHNYFKAKAREHFQAAVASVISSPNFSTFLTADPQAVKKTLLEAHKRGRDAFKTACPKVQMGMNLAIADDQAEDGGETKLQEYQNLCYDSYLEVADQDDFVAIQTYTRNLVGRREIGSQQQMPGKPRWAGNSIPSHSNIRSVTLRNTAGNPSSSPKTELRQKTTRSESNISVLR
jgi:hypothetical protein